MKNEKSELCLNEKENNELISAIEETKQGKEEGFKKLYDSTYQFVYSRAKMLCGSEQETSDIVQEVYISVYRGINTLKSNDSLFSWLKTIIFHTGGRIMKKKGNEILLSEESEEAFESLPDETEQTEQNFIDKQDVEIIRSCIDKLSDEQRAVILAYYYDNLKVEEIAELLSISVGTVKSRLFSARKKLKEYIQEEENKHGYKLHSFGATSLVFTLKSILQGNMETSKDKGTLLYNSICKKLKFHSKNWIANALAKSNKTLKSRYKNLKMKVLTKAADMGSKKIILSTVAAVTAVGVISGTVAIVISNFNNDAITNHISTDSNVVETSLEEIVSSEEVSSIEETVFDEPQSTEITSQPITSKNSSSIETTDVPFDINAIYNTYVDTIVINQKTRYYGYIGYFALEMGNDVLERFDRYGIPYKEDFAFFSGSPTEYCTENGEHIIFIGPDTDRLVIRDETDLYMGKENGGIYKRAVKIIDGEGIPPESNILPENCETLYTNTLVNYLGYDGYFVDEHTQEAIKKGYGTYPTEYYNVQTDSNIKFVFATRDVSDNDMDLILRRKVFERGIGSIPVNVVEYSDSIPIAHYDHFDYRIGSYYLKDYDTRIEDPAKGYSLWQGCIEIFTIGKNNNTEQEIKEKFKETYGYEYVRNVEHYFAGYFYVDGYDGICEVYKYYIY